MKSEEDCGEKRAALLCFSTQPVTVTSAPPQCLLTDVQGLGKKNCLQLTAVPPLFKISFNTRLLSSQGQRNSRRNTDELGNKGEG